MNKIRLIFCISCIVVLSVAATALFLNGLFFSSIVLFVLAIAFGVSVYVAQRKLIRKMELMISSIQYGEFNYKFTEKRKEDDIQKLSRSLNEALNVFRERNYSTMKEETETEAWQKLIRVLTHEMMNSLTPVISLAETFASQTDEWNDVNRDNYLFMLQAMQTIHRRSKGLVAFVENYRKLTRVNKPMPQWVELDPFLRNMLMIVKADNIPIDIDVIPQYLKLLADKNMLEHLMINLIKNAVEACSDSEQARIRISAFKVGSKTQITVEDTGCGILPEVQDKIFIPFYSTKSGGSGIGLSLCKQIMNLHNGHIKVQSQINTGTTLTLVF